MLRNTSGGEPNARRTAMAIPPAPMRGGALAFPPVAGLSFGKGKKRAVSVTPAKKTAPFVIGGVTTSGATKTSGVKPPPAAPFYISKFAAGAGGLKFGFPPAKAATRGPPQQQPRLASRHPSPNLGGGIARDSSVKSKGVGAGAGAGAGLLPQAFSWNGFKSGQQKPMSGSVVSGFGKVAASARSMTSQGNSTPVAARKIPLIPTLMTPTQSPNVVAQTPSPSVNLVKPHRTDRKRAPNLVLPSPGASRSAKRPKQGESFVMNKAKEATPVPVDNKQSQNPQPARADEAMGDDRAILESTAIPITVSSAWNPTQRGQLPVENDSIPVDVEATSTFDISSEIVLVPLSLSDSGDEDFYDRVKKMHSLLEQTRREQEEAHDRLLQSHAELSESLLDAITDLIAESGGCGLDQLSTDEGGVGDSVDTGASDLARRDTSLGS